MRHVPTARFDLHVEADIRLPARWIQLQEPLRRATAGVLPGQTRVPAWRTDTGRIVGTGELDSVAAQLVQGRRQHLAAEAAERVGILVVGEDEEDIGPSAVGECRTKVAAMRMTKPPIVALIVVGIFQAIAAATKAMPYFFSAPGRRPPVAESAVIWAGRVASAGCSGNGRTAS